MSPEQGPFKGLRLPIPKFVKVDIGKGEKAIGYQTTQPSEGIHTDYGSVGKGVVQVDVIIPGGEHTDTGVHESHIE